MDRKKLEELHRAHVNNGKGVYDQDIEVLEAQQRAIDKHPRQPFYNLNIDAGAMWARRLIDRMIAAERTPAICSVKRGPPATNSGRLSSL